MIGEKLLGLAEKKHEEGKIRDYLGISAIGMCPLKNYRQFHGKIKPNFSQQSLLAMQIGTLLHDWFEHNIKDSGIKVISTEEEVSYNVGEGIPELKGHIDLIAEIAGKPFIVDYKIVSEYSFKALKEPTPYYVDQLMTYGFIKDIDDCLLVYINKNDGGIKEFHFNVDKLRVVELIETYKFIMTSKEEPKVTPDKVKCKWCEYKESCFKVNNVATIEDKSEEIKTINKELELKYLDLVNAKDEIESEINKVKEEIKKDLNGFSGKGMFLKARYNPPTNQVTIDKDLVKKILGDDYEKVIKYNPKNGFYTLTLREE